MNLADRIARLETRLLVGKSAAAPLFFIVLDDEGADETSRTRVEHEGKTFTQREDETDAAFRDRVVAAIPPSHAGNRQRPVQPLFITGERMPLRLVVQTENSSPESTSLIQALPED